MNRSDEAPVQHPEEGTIHAWLDGALSADEAESVARHVAGCSTCAAAVAEARGLIAGASRIVSSLDVVRGNVIPAQPAITPAEKNSLWRRLRLTPSRAAIAAALLVAATSLLTVDRHVEYDVSNALPKPAAVSPPVVDSVRAPSPSPSPEPKVVANQATPRVKAAGPVAVPAAADTKTEAQPSAAAPPPSVAAVQVDSGRPADSVGARRMTTQAVPLSEGVIRSAMQSAPGFASRAATSGAAEGCYRLAIDTISWLRGLPPQFALAKDSSSGRNVVRALTAAGVPDSVVSGTDWQSRPIAGQNAVTLTRRTLDPPVTLVFTANGRSAEARRGNETRFVPMLRTSCRAQP